MSKIIALEDIYVDQLKDLYSAEIQLIEALPEMAQISHAAELQADCLCHLDQTYRHVERLEEILEEMDQRPNGRKCNVMIALIREARKIMAENAPRW